MFSFDQSGAGLRFGPTVIVAIPVGGGCQYTATLLHVPPSSARVVLSSPETKSPATDTWVGSSVADFVCSLVECFPLSDKPQAPGEPSRLFPPPARVAQARPSHFRDITSLYWVPRSDLAAVLGSAAALMTLDFAEDLPPHFLVIDLAPTTEEPPCCLAIAYVTPQVPHGHLFVPVPRHLVTGASLTVISAGTRRR